MSDYQYFRNYLTGKHAPGLRFRFKNKTLSRSPLLLPIAMKHHFLMRELLDGACPLHVFNTSDIHVARQRFNQLRCKYDFSYWAATNYQIRDINDPDNFVYLILNRKQDYFISIIQSCFEKKSHSRFIITKKGSRIGLTTCVQAYITWRQLYAGLPGNALFCGASDFNLLHLKANLLRHLQRKYHPSANYIYLPTSGYKCFFNPFTNPDAPRGIDFKYVHLADMSKWKDRIGKTSTRAYVAAISGVLLDYRTLVVLEGNRPLDFPSENDNLKSYYDENVRFALRPPHLLVQEAAYASLLQSDPSSTPLYLHIPL